MRLGASLRALARHLRATARWWLIPVLLVLALLVVLVFLLHTENTYPILYPTE
jgi:hypothetical protein